MNKLFRACAAVLLCTTFSCTPIMKMAYGIKNPKIETDQSLLKKSKKFGFRTDNLATVNEADYLLVLQKNGIPDANIFDKEGRYIEYRATEESCNAGLFSYIPKLGTDTAHKYTNVTTLQAETQRLRDLKGNAFTSLPEADYYVFIYWAAFTGKLNKDHVKAWEELAASNKKTKIAVIKVNLDIQDYWTPAFKNEIYSSMNKK
ncbi:hypothetical protein SAMN05421780_102364 [Flexibacter flexilis DSM 6793]|uniref:Lipoprotein n=1 Tax=Flexibacter flexilis DSM 6793 TaxID=927664 RepID=A0A1I1G4H9_9BACT|nr:hypothetical protein [Flexibacter flexilis]SFC04090.1 hypothetical protein SAMN05421780_102364 [Flexibacter flexilis DSM 6793]